MMQSVKPLGRPLSRAGSRRAAVRFVVAATLCVLAASLVWGLAGAFAASPSASPGVGAVTLHVGWTNDPDNLNPFIGSETSSYEIWMLNYDMLTGYTLDLQPKPDLATSWDTSADGLTWTFHLRSGVKWQDGVAFTAKDVAFTYNYIIKNQMGAFSSLTTDITKVVATDDTTVVFHCDKPKANMLRLWIPILPEHIWSKVSPKAAGTSFQNTPPIIGTGPFQTVEVKKGDYIKMVASPTYWGTKPTLDDILFVTYQNPDTMTQDLLGGSLDAAWGIPSAQFPKIDSDPNMQAISYNLLTWDYLSLNCYTGTSRGNPVLKDVAFRQALNWGIDRQRIVDLAFSGKAKPGTSIMTPDSWVNPDYHWQPPADQMYTYDPAKAKQLLDAAGYKDTNGDGIREGKDGKPIKLRLWARSESPESQKTGSLLTGWFRDLGLKIQYQVMDDGIYYDAIWAYQGNTFSPDFDMYLWNYDGYADPGDTLASFITSQIENWNEPAWSNADFDKAVDLGNSTIDPQKRAPYIWDAQRIFYEQSPEIALDYPSKLEAINTAKWDGWTRMYGGTGAAFYTSFVLDSYMNLKPKANTSSSSSANTTLLIVIGVVVVLIIVGIVLLMLRRRSAAEEE
jgi:peptide/nickel transport system substrate-binding protein